jgi:hypothetical protein
LPPPSGKITQLLFYFGINKEILEENYSGVFGISDGNFFPSLDHFIVSIVLKKLIKTVLEDWHTLCLKFKLKLEKILAIVSISFSLPQF